MKRVIRVLLVVFVSFFILSARTTCADTCEADLNNDGEVNKLDWHYFKEAYKAERGMTYCDSSDSSYPAPVPKTEQTTSYATGDDGDLEKGITWPNPRFTDNLDGTITDNLTGLIWLKDANCFGYRIWNNALSDSNGLMNGECGLTDGSNAGDWRLPNINELFSLVHKGYYDPGVPNTAGTGQWTEGDPFNNVQPTYYWSSTTSVFDSEFAWSVSMYGIYGYWFGEPVGGYDKIYNFYVWPVRGGQ